MNRDHAKSPVAGVIQRLAEAHDQTTEDFLAESADPHGWLDRVLEEEERVDLAENALEQGEDFEIPEEGLDERTRGAKSVKKYLAKKKAAGQKAHIKAVSKSLGKGDDVKTAGYKGAAAAMKASSAVTAGALEKGARRLRKKLKKEEVEYFRQRANVRLQFFPESFVDALNKPLSARGLHEADLDESALWGHEDLDAIDEGIAATLANMVEAEVDYRVIVNEVRMTLGPLSEMTATLRSSHAPSEELAEDVDIALDTLIAL